MNRRVAAVFFLCGAVGFSFALMLRSLRTKTSARSLLLEATRNGGPLDDIFEQQAGQGYYDDALATARLATSNLRDRQYELSGFVVTLIKIRAENGDIQGAKEMARVLNDSALAGRGSDVVLEIAKIQVDKGDLRGAFETCTSPADTNEVMEEFGNREIANGDFDVALETAEHVNERSAYNLFYATGDVLRQRGEERRLHPLASRMVNKERAAEFVSAATATFSADAEHRVLEMSPCGVALSDAVRGQFADAWRMVDRNKCQHTSYIAIKQYASEPVEAERKLLRSTDRDDVSYGIAEMSKLAAKNGDISESLSLLSTARRTRENQAFYPECVREIAWAWTIKSGPSTALDWARSLPFVRERGFALLGVAQALGHARPQ